LILFCDSSALVKLYVHEEESEPMAQRAAASDIIAVCRITWVEMLSALARRVREQPKDEPLIAQARQRLAANWPRYLTLELTQELAELAGDYTDTFALRAYDGVQLAAAQLVHRAMPGEVKFACFDGRLVKAARVLGIEAA
jgi:predicted nucleic acid-binding protein